MTDSFLSFPRTPITPSHLHNVTTSPQQKSTLPVPFAAQLPILFRYQLSDSRVNLHANMEWWLYWKSTCLLPGSLYYSTLAYTKEGRTPV